MRRRLMDKFNEAREAFADRWGTRFGFVFNFEQQFIARSKHDQGKARSLCYWDLEVVQRMWKGAELVLEAEIDRGKGVDKYLPTFSIFNTNSGENANLYIPELYFSQELFESRVFFAAGKLDLSDWFDGSTVAGSGDLQFTSDALINNLAIPFPAKGIGAALDLKPCDWFYFQTGASTAKASYTKTGLGDAFNSTFFINEAGFTPEFGPLKGNYRFIFHLEHQKAEYYSDPDENKRNQVGFAVSFDQDLTRRVTLFARYGFADRKVRAIEQFWSCGGELKEPFPGRKFDYLGAGFAASLFGRPYREYNGEDTSSYEGMFEVYYNCTIGPYLSISPNFQAVIHPNGDKTTRYEAVSGIRLLLSF